MQPLITAQFGCFGRLDLSGVLYLRLWLIDFGHQTQTAPVRETLAVMPAYPQNDYIILTDNILTTFVGAEN